MNLSQKPQPLRYQLDRWLGDRVMRVIARIAPHRPEQTLLPGDPSIRRILLVRVNFRMGNALLTLPAIAAARQTFPQAKIDFLGSPVSAMLFRHQGLDRHFIAPRRFPRLLWEYPKMMLALRANSYDLAVDVSCSQSGAAMFLIGLSAARICVGLAGRGDAVLNLKVWNVGERNKYRRMTEFLERLEFKGIAPVGSLALAPEERLEGRRRINPLRARSNGRVVGVFVGGRKLRGKRWPIENFLQVIGGLRRGGYGVAVFLGPEEADVLEILRAKLDPETPLIFERAVRKFAAIVANVDLLICCDSGPMHLACALGVRVVAIFQQQYVERWAPPAEIARIVVDATAEDVLHAALSELAGGPVPDAPALAREIDSAPDA